MERASPAMFAESASLVYPAYVIFVALALLMVLAFPVAAHIKDRKLKRQYYWLQLITFLAALLGAKLAVLVGDLNWPVEPLAHWSQVWFSGRSILGALILGFLAAEVAKLILHYPLPPNDRFATVLPFSIATGRIGCLIQGCCLGIPSDGPFCVTYADGIPRHPAQAVELLFNLAVGIAFVIMLRKNIMRGHLFALYLILYGAFRFFHEGWRDTPKFWEPVSAYQGMALIMVGLGLGFLVKRAFWPPASWNTTLPEGPS